MRLVRGVDELRSITDSWPSVGLVPTMGAIHAGHLALVERARNDGHPTVVSIFVNPLQFTNPDDLDRYPRTIDDDVAKLDAAGADVVFVPDVSQVYPDGFDTVVQPGRIADVIEGELRPGHFAQVATIVTKLIGMSRATHAYFGQKDAQQYVVVKHVARDLNLPCTIEVISTVRDADGLALSSRNVFLSDEERAAARLIPEALNHAQQQFEHGERSALALTNLVRETIGRSPIAEVQYVVVVSEDRLEELSEVGDDPALLLVAAQYGDTRLLDNLRLT